MHDGQRGVKCLPTVVAPPTPWSAWRGFFPVLAETTALPRAWRPGFRHRRALDQHEAAFECASSGGTILR